MPAQVVGIYLVDIDLEYSRSNMALPTCLLGKDVGLFTYCRTCSEGKVREAVGYKDALHLKMLTFLFYM